MTLMSELKLQDKDIERLLLNLNGSWEGELDLSGHLFRDETAIRLAKILEGNEARITRLKLDGNRLTSIGGKRLGQALAKNSTLKAISLHGMALGE